TLAQSLAAARAMEAIFAEHPEISHQCGILMDGHHNWLARGAASALVAGIPIRYQPKLDRDSAVVAAASVVAKVERDSLMATLSEQYPHYGWQKNCGYGSAAHRAAIIEHGL